MKKHEMVLDFTSLLDVILIILFLVLCTMNGKAQKDAAEIDKLADDNAAYGLQVKQQGDEIEDLTNKNQEQADLIEKLQQELAGLKDENHKLAEDKNEYKEQADKLQATLDKYLEISGLDGADLESFNTLKGNSITFELRDKPGPNPKKETKYAAYLEGAMIGTSLTLDPTKNEAPETIKNWLASIIRKYAVNKDKKIVSLVFVHDVETLTSSGKAVERAIKDLDAISDKGYTLLHTTVDIKSKND